jgi:hypothetical protein
MEDIIASWCGEPLLLRVAVGLIVAYGISIGIADPIVPWFQKVAGAKLPENNERDKDKGVPPELTGRVERLIFTSLIIVRPDAVLLATGGWLGLKMAANWNRDVWGSNGGDAHKRMVWNRHAFLALLTGLVSMSFAGAGGLLGRAIMCIAEINCDRHVHRRRARPCHSRPSPQGC